MTPRYNFDKGLAHGEQLELLIASPFLEAVAATLPRHGSSTKPSIADPAALLVMGVATVICGSDRAADREVAYIWPRLREHFIAAGYRVPVEPLKSHHFRYYRDEVLGGSLPELFKQTMRRAAVEAALMMGMFPNLDRAWNDPHLSSIVSADGTWFAAYSEVRDLAGSRSKKGKPLVLDDVHQANGKGGFGYMFCVASVRGPRKRQRIMLDIEHAPSSDEMAVVLPIARRIRAQLGDRFRCLTYDGAMHGVHHRQHRPHGYVTVNKPKGIRRVDQWKAHLGTSLGETAPVLVVDTACGCRHLVNLCAGLFWEVRHDPIKGYYRYRVLEDMDLRRSPDGEDTFRWEMDFAIRCDCGKQIFTVDPNDEEVPCATRRDLVEFGKRHVPLESEMNLADKLRIIQVNAENFPEVYGRRNDIESGNKSIKIDHAVGYRAKSQDVQRHDTDLWLMMLLFDAKAWKEFTQWVRSAVSLRARMARRAS